VTGVQTCALPIYRAEFYLVGVKPSINERDDGFRVLIS
jgi:hypothetical protein